MTHRLDVVMHDICSNSACLKIGATAAPVRVMDTVKASCEPWIADLLEGPPACRPAVMSDPRLQPHIVCVANTNLLPASIEVNRQLVLNAGTYQRAKV